MGTTSVAIDLRRGPAASVADEREVNDELTDGQLLSKFVEGGDQLAFELLVRRHAPMILGVCRRVLRNEHAAEDALQAVFVVLLRKAAAIQRPELLANWLYGVAFRIARKARSKAGREQSLTLFEPAAELDLQAGPERREISAVLDEELNQLPARHRLPLVICYLDGKTHVEAARLLGCPCGSVADRLARARAELRRRLLRRGLVLSVGLLLSLLRHSRASAAVDEELIGEWVDRAIPPNPDPRGARPDADSSECDRCNPDKGGEPSRPDESPSAIEDPTPHRKQRRSWAIWLALLWMWGALWVASPACELVGATIARDWGRDLPHLWTQLGMAVSAEPAILSASGQNGSLFGTADRDGSDPKSASGRRRLSDEERCKRCLGTQCGFEDDAPHKSSLRKRLFGR